MSGSGTTCTSGSPCTLAEVLSSATSGDTVDLAPGTYQPAGDTSFTISTSITVQSATPGSTVTLEGNGASVLGVDSSVTATVSGVSIEDGLAGVDGGGIDNSGTLTVQDSTIAGNAAQYAGGGIYNSGTLTVEDSTISGNSAGAGGGIYNSDTLSVEDSTIFANTALACVDGVDSSGQLCVAPFDGGGGGIYNQGTGTIEASTLTANSVNTGYGGAFGGGINNSDDNSLTLAADIIAEQSAGGDCSNSLIPVTDAGYNVDDDGTCGLSASNNSISDSTVIDDYLGTLGANGGPTETVPLLATASPTTSSADPALGVIPSTFDLPIALNGVSLACSIPDQRGVTPDQPCDMGAFSLTLDTVAFTADGGGAVASITGLDGSSITLPSDTYPGYSFTGWFTAASGGTEVGGAGASYAISLGGVTLYAQWSANATDDYSFNAAGGAPTPTAGSGLDGTTITLPGAPTRAAYTFAGWNDGTTTYGASSPYTLSSGGKPIVFTAQWSAAMDNYSFNTAGGSPTPTAGAGSNGTTITLPAAPTQAGYTFAGWSVATTNPSGEMAPPAGYSASQEVLEDQFANLNNWNTYYGPGTPWQNRGKLPSPYSGGNQPNSNDMAYYSPTQDVLMSGGGVSLEATPNNQFSSQGYTWESGVLTSKNPLPSSGWYVQVEAQMPDTSAGFWPAIWALPSSSAQELDGFEGGWPGSSPNLQGHSDTFAASGQIQQVWATPGGANVSSGYNTYGFQYIPGTGMRFYFNGTQVYSSSANLSPRELLPVPPAPGGGFADLGLAHHGRDHARLHADRRGPGLLVPGTVVLLGGRHLHPLERGHAHRLHRRVDRQRDRRLQLQRGGRRADPGLGLRPERHHHHPDGRPHTGGLHLHRVERRDDHLRGGRHLHPLEWGQRHRLHRPVDRHSHRRLQLQRGGRRADPDRRLRPERHHHHPADRTHTGGLHLRRVERRDDHLRGGCHLHPLERGQRHRLHRQVERQCHRRLQLQRGGRRADPQPRARA